MFTKVDTHGAKPVSPESLATPAQRVPLSEIDSPILLQGIRLWKDLCRNRRFPQRSEISARTLKPVLRNTTLVRVIDGGRDYEYRIVGDAFVMAHGKSFQGKLWSQTDSVSPGYQTTIKPIFDEVVRTREPVATRGWVERDKHADEHIYCEYVLLPLGAENEGVDHILVFAVYVRTDGIERARRVT